MKSPALESRLVLGTRAESRAAGSAPGEGDLPQSSQLLARKYAKANRAWLILQICRNITRADVLLFQPVY